jgi:hypothetical protein
MGITFGHVYSFPVPTATSEVCFLDFSAAASKLPTLRISGGSDYVA